MRAGGVGEGFALGIGGVVCLLDHLLVAEESLLVLLDDILGVAFQQLDPCVSWGLRFSYCRRDYSP